MNRTLALSLSTLTLLGLAATGAQAQTAAYTLSGGAPTNNSNYTDIGFVFTTTGTLIITDLGVYVGSDGGNLYPTNQYPNVTNASLVDSHTVGIYSYVAQYQGTGTLLGSTTVASGQTGTPDANGNRFVYSSLGTALTLAPGKYIIESTPGASRTDVELIFANTNPGSSNLNGGQGGTDLSTNIAGLTINAARFNNLNDPDITASNSSLNFALQENRYLSGGIFGPNFIVGALAAAPEPSQFAAFAVGLLGLGALTVKAKRRISAS